MSTKNNLKNSRREYIHGRLDDINLPNEPCELFNVWLNEAINKKIQDANAFALATVDKNQQPRIRTLLLKEIQKRKFIFFSNYNSAKGQELANTPKASMLFFWKELERQVRVEGIVNKTSQEVSRKYFQQRPLASNLTAMFSQQSEEVSSRSELEARFKYFMKAFIKKNNLKIEVDAHNNLNQLQCPANWGGYQLQPHYFEFWQGRKNRLHDRIVFKLQTEKVNKADYILCYNDNQSWLRYRLFP